MTITQSTKKKQKEFPALLSNHNSRLCNKCFCKQQCFLYHEMHSYNRGIDDISSDTISSKPIYNQSTDFLTETHLQYMNKWIELIDLEEAHCHGTRREIWTMNSQERENKKGKCLGNMMITNYEQVNFKHIYTFIKHPDYRPKENSQEYVKLWNLKLHLNDRIIISSEDGKYGLSKGSLVHLNTKYIKYATYKPIRKLKTQENGNHVTLYRLDLDDEAYGFSEMRANIFYYFMSNENNLISKKRKSLVDLIPPSFAPKQASPNIPTVLEKAYAEMNTDQQHAIEHVLRSRDYALILGMPGTGSIQFFNTFFSFLDLKNLKCIFSSITHTM